MSDDELEKLAQEMQNISPSETARERGMAAAMAAFDMEFAREAAADNVTESVKEKTSNTSQGLANQPRPTGQNTHEWHVLTLGRDMMARFRNFNFTPKAVMMGGSCMAALLVSMVFYDAGQFGNPSIADSPKAIEAVEPLAIEPSVVDPVVVKPAETPKDIVVPQVVEKADTPDKKVETAQSIIEEEVIVTAKRAQVSAPIAVAVPPQPNTGINSVNDLLNRVRSDSARTASENKIREQKFRQRVGPPSRLFGSHSPEMAAAYARHQSQLNTPTAPVNPITQSPQTGGLILEEVPAEYKTETKTIVTKEATTELVKAPPVYETVTETVVVKPQAVEYVSVPPQYEWVEGEIAGNSIEYETVPAEYETVSEAVVVQEASTELVTIPATFNSDGTIATPAQTQERVIPSVTKMETRRVVKTPAKTVERIVPNVIKDGKTRVAVKPGKTVERAVPAVTKQVSRRVIKTPASTQERVVPAGTRKDVVVRTEISPQKFYLRDEDGKVIREFASRDAFESYKANPIIAVADKPVSTFSIDVDTASYSFMRASLNRGQLPPRASIRLEEMINYFPDDYDAPRSADEPFKANISVTPTPWNADTKLMHIGIKGYVPPKAERPRSNLVFLIDTSGSMNNPNKLPLLINSFKLLLNTLGDDDTVSIVTYAGRAGTVLEPTPASDKHKIKDALTRLRAGGSTAGAAGLELAYQKAQESFDDEANNRVILATDGDFNVGFSSHEEMKEFITKKRETGIFLSVLGFGQGNYNDQLMQALAQNGNGVAAYIDNLNEANKVLANEAGSSLTTIAKDVKIQVEFNPETISEYRLIGYETRALKRQDFNNDKVDAGEIGAGHTVTAIYELTPVGSPAKVFDPLRYVDSKLKTTGSNEYAFVKIRHKLPDADTSTLQTFPVSPKQERSLKRTSDDTRFAAAVAAFGQKLRSSPHLADYSYDELIEMANSAKGDDENGYRAEFIQLVRLAKELEMTTEQIVERNRRRR